MKQDIFYYFIKKENDKAIITTDCWIGDIGDYVTYKSDSTWNIVDYTWEFYDLNDTKEVIY